MAILLNKRNTFLALAGVCILSLTAYQYSRAHINHKRVESVILHDQNIQDEYGQIEDYHIENVQFYLDHSQIQSYHYDLSITGNKKSGKIALHMQQIPEQEGYRYSIQSNLSLLKN